MKKVEGRSRAARDAIGRRMPSKEKRTKRARKAAQLRWKNKWQLEPGRPTPWSRRSFANKLRHLEIATKGGRVFGEQIKNQQDLFWRWAYDGCKKQLSGPFKTVVETFEQIVAAYDKTHGTDASKDIAWEGFEHHVFTHYILAPCARMAPEIIERDMWERYETFMGAEHENLLLLLKPMFEYDARKKAWWPSKPRKY